MTNWKKDGMDRMEQEMIEDFLGYSKHKPSSHTKDTRLNKNKRKYSQSTSSSNSKTQRVYPQYDRTGNLENADELSWQAYLDSQEDDY
jgi:hypothetical protein